MARWRSSFWRGRPARELTRSEPLDVVSRLFKASLAGALTSLSFVALWCVRLCCAWCVAFADLPHTHTHTHTGGGQCVRRPKWGVWLESSARQCARSLFRRPKWGVVLSFYRFGRVFLITGRCLLTIPLFVVFRSLFIVIYSPAPESRIARMESRYSGMRIAPKQTLTCIIPIILIPD